MIFFGKNYFLDPEGEFESIDDILNLIRLQKQLLIQENTLFTLIECRDIWQRYSNDLSASWLFFPEKDEDILKQISSSDYFTSYEDYSK